jgi:hypothetical protein
MLFWGDNVGEVGGEEPSMESPSGRKAPDGLIVGWMVPESTNRSAMSTISTDSLRASTASRLADCEHHRESASKAISIEDVVLGTYALVFC